MKGRIPAASWLSCAALAAIDGVLLRHLAAGAPADPGARNPKGPGFSLRRRGKGLVDQPLVHHRVLLRPGPQGARQVDQPPGFAMPALRHCGPVMPSTPQITVGKK